LAPGSSVVLQNNGSDPLTITSNGSFAFPTARAPGAPYNVTVRTQPPGQHCVVNLGTGTVASSNVANIALQCPLETVLWNFLSSATAPHLPVGALMKASDGNFYGTTLTGGTNLGGAVFKMTSTGAVSTLWNFGAIGDGVRPNQVRLIQGSDGNLYGTTQDGGAYDRGTVFRITLGGVGTVLWSFRSTGDGGHPQAGVIQGSDGNFYGTTQYGGTNFGGTVFRVTPTGTETVLWNFDADSNPYAALVQGQDGNFYGTTMGGGTNGRGTVFRITPAGQHTVLWNFGSGNDGRDPGAELLLAADGNFYGTTYHGGTFDWGVVFRITPAGAETVVWNFGLADDGKIPEAGLIQSSDGNFYGTTASGGAIGGGTVFRLTPAGVENVLWDFATSSIPGSGGAAPYAGLLQDGPNTFYGTTYGGGTNLGTIFRLTL
jgi:uncharacterized repeat protein (TIGR03803 family)